jgi:hypothetical protein
MMYGLYKNLGFKMETIVQPKIDIEEDLVKKAKENLKNERQVVVHVTIKTSFSWWQLRIWPSTFFNSKYWGETNPSCLMLKKIPFLSSVVACFWINTSIHFDF